MATRTPVPNRSKQTKRPSPTKRRGARSRTSWRRTTTGRTTLWAVGAIAAVGIVGAFLAIGGRSPKTVVPGGKGRVAPSFTLASTAGGTVSLSAYRGQDVLLYFSEGVGCDPCFSQMVDIEKNALFQKAGLTVVPIVVDQIDQVRQQIARFGIKTPYLIDQGAQVSTAYGVLGKGMHADLPGHGFVLVDGSGRIRWYGEYPSMYISSSQLFSQIRPYLG